MALKFFNILDIQTFSEKSESEQKTILIDAKIYIKGKSIPIDFSLEEGEIWRGSSRYPKYLGQDFEFDGVNYKLNDDYLNEVFNECAGYIKLQHVPLIENNLETIKLQAEFSGDNFITELRQKEIKSYNNYLPGKLFKKLHTSDFENEQQHFDILKSFLSINWYDLSDYLFGLNNISNYHIVSNYYSYVRTKRTLIFLNSKRVIDETAEIDFTNPSVPKSIAMLYEAGFFELEKVKKLSPTKLIQVIAIVIGKDPNNKSEIRKIKGNYNVLKIDSDEDSGRYTSHTHTSDMFKLLK